MATESNCWSLARSYRFCTTVLTNTRLIPFLGRCKTKVKRTHTHTHTDWRHGVHRPACTRSRGTCSNPAGKSTGQTTCANLTKKKTKKKNLTDKTTAELMTLSVHDEQVSLVFDRRADNERKRKKKERKKTKNKIDEWYTGTYCVLV